MKKVYAREEYCIDCRLCELACRLAHSPFSDLVTLYRQTGDLRSPGIRVQSRYPRSFGLQCRHCDDPACVQACISGALYKDERGVVVRDGTRCVSCLTCVAACSFGAIQVRDSVPEKCDLCRDRDMPACVEVCPNRALVYEERDVS